VVVFNGDVLTEIDLAAVLRLHRERRARATIVLTPVEDPTAYGVVETDPDGNIRRFLEKPRPEEVTTHNINAGIYVLEPDTFDRIPSDVAWSIERSYFPSLVERGETFVAYIYDGYWIDIGTPQKYTQVHRDIMDGRFRAPPFRELGDPRVWIAPDARIEENASVSGPCFIDEGALVRAGARVGPYSVIGRQTHIHEDAAVEGAILWPNCRVDRDAIVRDAILGRHCHIGRSVTVNHGAVLGDKTTLTDYTRV
jgi:NDP-sugar pyrophosphorylase family protein